jgi:TPR repeat protein
LIAGGFVVGRRAPILLVSVLALACGECARAPSMPSRAAEPTRCTVTGGASPFLFGAEAAMASALDAGSVVFVAYSCDGIRVVPGCTLRAPYRYFGMDPVATAVDLASADELKLNAPNLSGSSRKSMRLVTVGQRATTVAEVDRDKLGGACKEATHFVRRVQVGWSGSGAAPAACTKANPDAESPSSSCATPLRAELVPIGEHLDPDRERGLGALSCPGASVLVGTQCELASEARPFRCEWGNTEQCTRQCERGNKASCGALAWMVHLAATAPADEERALKLSSDACDAGVAPACTNAATLELEGETAERAISRYERGCRLGDAEGCVSLGMLHFGGNYPFSNPPSSFRWFLRGCAAGSAAACGDLALSYEHGLGVGQDGPRAAVLATAACESGEPLFCSNAGVLYLQGAVIKQDLPRARGFFERACAGKSPLGCANLGLLYEAGQGVSQDFRRAVELYRQACEGGSGLGCRRLGIALEAALGQPRDFKLAAQAYDQGCELGDAGSCSALGALYIEGHLGDTKAEYAAELLARACKGGSADGCYNLGVIYRRGQGVAKDDAIADKLRHEACTLGMDRACREEKKSP